MNIVAAFKVVPDDQDIQIKADRTLDYSKAHRVVSTYDLNAIEACARLADAAGDSHVTAVTVGPSAIDDSKLKKNVLARGVDELFMIADDACSDLDAHATAQALAEVLDKVGSYDVIICGDGSADNYAQQVDVQLAAVLGVPVVNGATRLTPQGDALIVERTLEDVVETVEVSLPAIVSVAPDAALPRIPGMKDILAAGKKPADRADAQGSFTSSLKTVSVLAPEQADRKGEIFEADAEGAIERFAAALKAAQ